jgi:hypothetical protein
MLGETQERERLQRASRVRRLQTTAVGGSVALHTRKYQILGALKRSNALWTAARIAFPDVLERSQRLFQRGLTLIAGTPKKAPVSLFPRVITPASRAKRAHNLSENRCKVEYAALGI